MSRDSCEFHYNLSDAEVFSWTFVQMDNLHAGSGAAAHECGPASYRASTRASRLACSIRALVGSLSWARPGKPCRRRIWSMLPRQRIVCLPAAGGDTIVRGCTHHPIVAQLVLRLTGSHADAVENGTVVDRVLGHELTARGIRDRAGVGQPGFRVR